MPELIGLKQVCKALSLSDRSVRRLIDAGQLKAEKQGGKLLFDAREVRRLRDDRCRNAESRSHKGAVSLSLKEYSELMTRLGELQARSNYLIEYRTSKNAELQARDREIEKLREELDRLRGRGIWGRIFNK